MSRIDYPLFPGFEDLYLEDSYLLGIETNSAVDMLVEAVLRETHPMYTPPKPGERYSYRTLVIHFPEVKSVEWINKRMTPTRDPDGSVDYGNIDEFHLMDGRYHIKGDWGELAIVSAPPQVLEPTASKERDS